MLAAWWRALYVKGGVGEGYCRQGPIACSVLQPFAQERHLGLPTYCVLSYFLQPVVAVMSQ